jgi:hypothetical protein
VTRRLFALVALWTLVATAAPVTAGAGTEDAGAEPSPPVVEVLDRGDSPRTDLRFQVPAGTTQTLRMRTYARISQTIGGQTRSGSTPSIRFSIDSTVDEVGADGNLTLTYEFASIEVSDSSSAESTRDALEPLIGVRGTLVITDKGALVDNSLTIPPGLEPEAEQLFDQLESQATALTIPFPDGKVGIGGSWRAASEVELSGIMFRQSTTYTVERSRRGRTTLSVEVRQTAPRQRFTPPGTTDEILLISSKGTGSGTSVVAPAESVMPVGGRSDVSTRQRLEASGDRISQTTSLALFLNERR